MSQSGYYARKQREPSKQCREDAQLSADIQEIFVEHARVYGSPRIFAVLEERGWKTSRKRVARLMRQVGLSAQTHRSRKPTRPERSTSSLRRQYAQSAVQQRATRVKSR